MFKKKANSFTQYLITYQIEHPPWDFFQRKEQMGTASKTPKTEKKIEMF